MGVPFYIVCLDLFMVDDASEAVEELNRLKLKNAWLKKTLQALKKRRKEMEKKLAEEKKKWVAEIEESNQKLIAFEEQIKKIERLNAYAIWTNRGGMLDWVYKAVAASTGALAGVALVSFFHLRKKQ